MDLFGLTLHYAIGAIHPMKEATAQTPHLENQKTGPVGNASRVGHPEEWEVSPG